MLLAFKILGEELYDDIVRNWGGTHLVFRESDVDYYKSIEQSEKYLPIWFNTVEDLENFPEITKTGLYSSMEGLTKQMELAIQHCNRENRRVFQIWIKYWQGFGKGRIMNIKTIPCLIDLND